MATDTMTMLKGIAKRQDEIEAYVQKMSKGASKAGNPNQIMAAGFLSAGQKHEWPEKRLQQLAKAYSHDAVVNFLAKDGNGKPRGIGWGPMLRDMAATQTMGRCGYTSNSDKNEKEYGLYSVEKAREHGIPGSDGIVRKTALAEGSGLTGGYIVPPDFQNELLTIAAEDAFVEPRAKVMPMNTRTMQIPMLDITTAQSAGTSPYFGGILATWQPEAATISETEPQFKQTELTAWDLVLYTVSSNQLLADNAVGLDALLTQLFGAALTWYKEYAFLRGTGAGSSMPLGIINAAATYVQARAITSHFILVDAANMMARLHVRSWDSACWIMHQSVLADLIQMNDNTGAQRSGTQNVGNMLSWVNPLGQGDGGPLSRKLPIAFLNGLPVFFTEKLPTLGTKGDVMLVDLSHYLIGNRLEMQIDVSDQYLFRNNQLAWRVVARADGKPWLNNVVTDSNGWVSSPFVCLNT